jgi:hypothetical protein
MIQLNAAYPNLNAEQIEMVEGIKEKLIVKN